MQLLRELLSLQNGVISRAQIHERGLTAADLRRLLRRRDLTRVHPGVFVDHTGQLSWVQRAWAAVLFATPSALCAESALRADDGPGRSSHDDAGPIHLAVDRSRKILPPPGVIPHRLTDLGRKALWNLGPPRLRVEEAVIDVASGAASDFAAIATLADSVHSRRTTAKRILATMEQRTRLPRREFLRQVLRDIDDGACSALEHAYLIRVERRHGLPVALRQVSASSNGPIYRDVEYAEFGLIVELDGRVHHNRSDDRDRDLDRDLSAMLDGRDTVRLGWGQVVDRPCETALSLHRLLTDRGWPSALRRCQHCVLREVSE